MKELLESMLQTSYHIQKDKVTKLIAKESFGCGTFYP